MKLSEWENRLHQEFERIELIGELEVSETQIAELSPQIKYHIDIYGPKGGLGVLLRQYHRTWMTYLVFQGVYGYSDGDYWTSIADSVGIYSRNELSVWGRLFFQSLERFSLPTFPGVEGNRYVMRILLHGGIPQSALPNFFEHFLAHFTDHPELAGLGPDDLIEYALANTSAQYGLTKPVLRFLAYGGSIAADFITRCMDLATVHAATGKVPSGNQVGLPERVVNAYLEWHKERSLPVRRMLTRLQRPLIVFDAYADGVTAVLPGQSLENLAVYPQAGWTVSYGDASLRQWVPVYRRTDGWQTKEDSVVLSSPFTECRIAFDDGRELAHTWQFGGLESRRPLILFDAATGRLKAWSEDVPAGQYWLVFPKTYSVGVPDGVLREDAGTLPWDWGSYRAQLWDLSAAKAIELRETSKGGRGQPVIIRVAADAAELRPWLTEGGVAVGCRAGVGGGTVYAGDLPRICIPVSPQRTAETELLRWRILLIEPRSEQPREVALDRTCKGIRSAGSHVEIDLVAAGLVPAEPFGTFEIQLRGPLGRDMTFVLVSVPRLQIGGNDRVRVARPDGLLPAAKLEISCASWIEVDSLEFEVGVERVNAGAYLVHAPAERSEVELRLTSSSASVGRAGTDVYIQVPAPVLQWSLLDGQQFGRKADWHITAVVQAKAWLEQSQQPQLVVSISPPAATQEPVRGTLAVAYRQFGTPQIVEPQFSTSRFLRFDLRKLRDSVRSSKLMRIPCALELQSLGGYNCEVSVPSVFFTQAIQFDNVSLTARHYDDAWQLDVGWEAAAILVGRCARLWSLSRPWQPPLDLPIPDEAADHCSWQVAANQLPPGNYRLQLLVLDAWSPVESVRPSRECPNCVDVVLGSVAEVEVYMGRLP